MATVEWTGDAVRIIDQTRLPDELVWIELRSPEAVAEAITTLSVRGAPAIGAVAALGMVLAGRCGADLEDTARMLVATRPTAVNLAWAVHRTLAAARREGSGAALTEALAILEEDVAANRALGAAGAALLPDPCDVITHCNAGALATVDYGTALGVVRAVAERGTAVHVWVGETRPVLQGARLTAWELERDGIPVTVVADTAMGSVMARDGISAVVVGADRVAANGDVANKIGTYTLAVLAARHRIPFYVAAPTSSIDLATADGNAIVIEERDPDEVRTVRGSVRLIPEATDAWNPAFDITPNELVTAIITENGVVVPPFDRGLRDVTPST